MDNADRTIPKEGTSNYITSSMKMWKGISNELSDDFVNITTAQIKKLNQNVGNKKTTQI